MLHFFIPVHRSLGDPPIHLYPFGYLAHQLGLFINKTTSAQTTGRRGDVAAACCDTTHGHAGEECVQPGQLCSSFCN